MRVNVANENLSEATQAVLALPGLFERARKSALKSTGWWIMSELRDYVERGGEGWPGLHPLTLGFFKKRGARFGWTQRRSGRRHGPLLWLGKFARYLVDDRGTSVQIDFGKSRKGQPGSVDPGLAAIARRAERGERIPVTERMRRLWGATRGAGRGKRGIPGRTYFPLSRHTTVIEIPKRPIFGPVFRRIQPQIAARFDDRFWAAYRRYESEKKGKS